MKQNLDTLKSEILEQLGAQGFAVFGRVVDGWDVVKKIHQAQTGKDGDYKTETLDPPIKILRAYRK